MLSPTDAAWSVLEEGHRVDKALPLLIPAAMAAYGGYRGAQNVKRNEISEPFFGTAIAEGDDSLGSTALQFGSGLAEGIVPVKGGGFLARRFGGRRAAKRAAARQAAEKEAAEAAARHRALVDRREVYDVRRRAAESTRGPLTPGTAKARADRARSAYVSPSQLGAERQAFNAAQARAAQLAPRAPPAQPAPLTLGQRAKRGAAITTAAGAGAAAAYTPEIMMALGMGPFSPTDTEFPDFGAGAAGAAAGFGAGQGGQQGFQLANQPSGGVGGVQNVGVSGMADHDIFRGRQFQSAPTSSNMQASSIKQKGTAMSLGNDLINSAFIAMENSIIKATSCKECNKKDCLGKMHCGGTRKADKKKPAHGMVIVIGSKAGPGPSTDGKRDDKKDKDD